MKTIKKIPAELLDQVDEEYNDELRPSNPYVNKNILEPTARFIDQ